MSTALTFLLWALGIGVGAYVILMVLTWIIVALVAIFTK